MVSFLNNGYTGLRCVKNLDTPITNSVVKINPNLFHISFCFLKAYENCTWLHKKYCNIAKKNEIRIWVTFYFDKSFEKVLSFAQDAKEQKEAKRAALCKDS